MIQEKYFLLWTDRLVVINFLYNIQLRFKSHFDFFKFCHDIYKKN